MDKKQGLMLVFFTALVSGLSIFINKFAVAGIDSSIFTFSKNIIAAIFLFSSILLIKEFKTLLSLKKSQWLKLILIGFIGGSIPFLLFFKGLQLTQAPFASFIHKTMFLFVAIFALIFLKEKINKNYLIASFLILLGNILLLKFVWKALNLGDFLILTATLFWAAENTISKHTLKELSGTIVAFGRMFFGSLFILIFLAFTNKLNLILTLTIPQYLWILLTSAFLFLYVITWYNGLKYVKVSIATQILLTGSPITTLASYFFLNTSITLSQIIGILLLISGITTSILFAEKVKTTHKHIYSV